MPSEQPPTRVDCPFCDYEGPSEVLYHGRFDYIIEPLNPVTPGHLLIIPHAHVSDFADVGTVSGEAIRTAAWWVSTKDRDGDYNLITSKGEAASQTIEHLHFHLIPRRKGDGLVLPWSDPAPPSEQPREGTRDDLAARLEAEARYCDAVDEFALADRLREISADVRSTPKQRSALFYALEAAQSQPREGTRVKCAAQLARASTHPEQQAKALEAADELADSITDEVLSGASWTGVLKAAIAYRSARSTSTKEDG